jgi:hypothetical protein
MDDSNAFLIPRPGVLRWVKCLPSGFLNLSVPCCAGAVGLQALVRAPEAFALLLVVVATPRPLWGRGVSSGSFYVCLLVCGGVLHVC